MASGRPPHGVTFYIDPTTNTNIPIREVVWNLRLLLKLLLERDGVQDTLIGYIKPNEFNDDRVNQATKSLALIVDLNSHFAALYIPIDNTVDVTYHDP